MQTGVELIAEERQRQIEVEGYTVEKDKKYIDDTLAVAGAAYALPERYREFPSSGLRKKVPIIFPFGMEYWKPTPENRIRELQKAGALIAAEIDRLLLK